MLLAVIFLAASVASVIAAFTSGLYRISSNYFLLAAISQDGGDIYLDPVEQGRLEQLWSVIITNGTATIQNVGTKAFFSVDADGIIVPSDKPHNWTFTPDTPSAAGIVSGRQAVLGDFEGASLILSDGSGAASLLWNFIPTVPQPHAYRVWNEATNMYLDQVLGECDFPDPCILASAFNASSKSQVWHVAGTSSCGGRPTLQNAASSAFLVSGPDFTNVGTRADLGLSPFPWRYGFVGGQLTLHDKDLIEDITTLTVFRGTADLFASDEGPGTAPEQTWVFIPAYE